MLISLKRNFLGATMVLVAGLLLIFISLCANAADEYPSKTITFVLPVPPGNAGDLAARVVAEKLSKNIKQSVVVENRVGAGGNIGAAYVAKAPADGYTVLIGSSGLFTTNEHLYKLPFNPHTSFIPVTLIYSGAPFLVTNAKTGPTSINEVLEISRKQPGKYSYASYGAGHISHILGEMFKNAANIDMLHIPYKNAPLTDVMSGQVDLIFESPLLVATNSTRLKPLAVVSAKRNPKLPDVPAVAEFLPGFEMTGWIGAFLPEGTPEGVVNRLHSELLSVINSDDFKKRMEDQMLDPGGNSPKDFAAYIIKTSERVGRVVKENNIKVD
jgi:tripartite-type tricarboxylate transporter receptor subunit TctC